MADSSPYCSQILGAGVTVCVVLASSRYGWDIHVWDLTYDKLVAGRQVSFAAQALFILSTWLAKTSILLNYLRLAPRGSWFRRLSSTFPIAGLRPIRDATWGSVTNMLKSLVSVLPGLLPFPFSLPSSASASKSPRHLGAVEFRSNVSDC